MEFELDGSLKEWVKDKPLSILQLDPADRAVLRIADERDAIQKKTFTKWVNKHLKKASRHVGDLFEDLRDGHNLISLLEVLSGEHLPRERGRMRFHMLQNVQMALDFLRYKKIKLVNIRAEDIVDGNPKLTLGLIWTIILHFQSWRRKISDIVVGQEPNVTAREALLRWARRSTARYPGVRVTDFTGSWRDGLAFSALIHRNRPDLVDWRGARASQPRERLDRVFYVAEREYGVTRLLDPEDVDTPEPDEKSLITYISSLYDVFPEPPSIHPLYDAEAQRRSAEYRELANFLHLWIREKMSLMQERAFPPTLIEMKKLAADSTKFKNEEVPPRYRDKQRLAYIFRDLQKYFEAVGEVDMEPELHIDVIEKNWNRLMMLHQEREQAIVDEIKRLERLQRLAEKVHREMKTTDNRLEELERRVEDEARRLDRLHPLEAKHAVDLLEQDIRNTEIQIQNIFTDVHTLTEGRYSQAAELHKRVQKLHQRWVALRSLLHKRLVQPLSAVSFPVEERVVTKHRTTVHETRLVDTNPHFRALHDCIDWCKAKVKQLQEADYGSDLPSVQNELDVHQREHKNIEQFHPKVDRCVQAKNHFHGEELTLYSQHLTVLQKLYAELLSASNKRLSDLDTLHDFIQSATGELVWLSSKEETEVTRDWSDKNLNVQSIEQYYESLMSDLEKREIQFSAVQDRGEALLLQHHPAAKTIEAYMSAMQSQWAWLLQLTLCLEVHLKHAAQSQQLFREIQQAEQWIAKRDETLNTIYSQSDFSLDEGERLLKGMQELREELNSYGDDVQKLVEQAKDVVPMKQRRQPVTRPMQVTCVCSYKQVNMSIEKGEQCTLYDNSGRIKWRVKNEEGVESPVPGVCFALQPPDKDALDAAERLRRQYDRSVALWQRKQLRLRQNMIFATIKVVKGWDLPQFLAMGQDQRTAIRKALNEDAEKLLSEGDPADPQLRRLKREMAEVNKLFDELEKRARAEEESKNAGRIFNEQVSALQQALDEAERVLSARIAAPLPRDLDSLEHLVLQHKDYEQSLRRLAPDLDRVQQTFRGITLKTPAMRNKLDAVTTKWNHIWNASNLYIERLKCVEILLSSLEENTSVISEIEVKLASFDELPSDLKSLQNVLEDLRVLQNAITQQQIAMDQLNEDAHNARRLVEKSRSSHRGPHTDMDRLDAEVNRLNARWTNVCGQLVDRVRSAEAAYSLAQQLEHAYRNEVDFVDESYGKLEAENTKNLLNRVVERAPAIEAVNVTGGRLIREGKIYGQRLRAFKEQLEDICPSLDASVKKPRREFVSTVDDVARDLDNLNRKYTTLVNNLEERVRQLASVHPEDASIQRVLEEQRPLRTFRTEFNIYESSTCEERYTSTTTHYTQSHTIKAGVIDPSTAVVVREPNGKAITFDEAIRELIVDPKAGTVTNENGKPIDFREALELGLLLEARQPMTFSEAISKGILDERTNTFLDPQTGVYLSLLEAIQRNLIDTDSVTVKDVRSGSRERISLMEAVRTGYIDGSTGKVNVTADSDMCLQEAYDAGLIVDHRAAVSLQRAIHRGLYDEQSGKITDPITGRSVTLHEAMRNCLLGLIVDIETAEFSLDRAIRMNIYDPCSGRITHPSTNQKLTLTEACRSELIDPLTSVVRDIRSDRYVPLSEAISLGVIDDIRGTYNALPVNEAPIDLKEALKRGYVVPSKLPLSIQDAVGCDLYKSETGVFVDPRTNECHDLICAFNAGLLDPDTTALKDATTGQITSVSMGIENGTVVVVHGRILDSKTKRAYPIDVALERGLLVTLDKPLTQQLARPNLRRKDESSRQEYTLQEAIDNNLFDPNTAVMRDPKSGRFVTIDSVLADGILDPASTGTIDSSSFNQTPDGKLAPRFVRFGNVEVYFLRPLTFEEATEKGYLSLESGKFTDPKTGELVTLKEAVRLGIVDSDSALIKDIKKEELVKLAEAFRKGLMDAEKGNVLETENSRLYPLLKAVEAELLITPKRGLSFIETLEFGLYDTAIGSFNDPFRVVASALDRNPTTLKEAIDSGSIDPSGTVIKVPETGQTVSLLEAINAEIVDPVVGRLIEEPSGKSLDFAKALDQGYILTADARQTVEEKYKLCDESSSKLLQWISEVEDKLASQENVKEDIDELRNQINAMKEIKEDLEAHSRPISSCLDQIRQVVLTGGNVLSSEEVSTLERNGRSLKTRFDRASDRTERMVKRLIAARDELDKFKNELSTFSHWLDNARRILEEKEHSLSDLNRLNSSTDATRDFISDVIAHQADLRFITMAAQKFVDESKEFLHVLNEFRTSLPQRLPHKEPIASQDSPVRGEVSIVTAQYKDLLSRANLLSDKLSGVGGRQRDYRESLEKARSWLKEIEPKVHRAISESIAAEPKQVEDQLCKAKALNNEMLANERLVENVKVTVEALLRSLDGQLTPKEVDELEEPVKVLEDKYRQLANAIGEKCQELDAALVRSQGVQDALDSLVLWLNNIESQFKNIQRPASLQKERLEEQQRDQRLLQADLDSHRLSVEAVATSAKDLLTNSSNARIAKRIESKLKDVQGRFEKLMDKSLRRGEFLDEIAQTLGNFLVETTKFDGWYAHMIEALESRDLCKLDVADYESKMVMLMDKREDQRGNFEDLIRNGKNLISQRDVTDVAPIRDKIKALESQWKEVNNLIDEKQRLSKSRAEQLSAYEKLRDQVIDWLTRTENKVQRLEPVAVDLEKLKRQTDELKPIQKEYRDYGNTVDKVNDLGIAYDGLLKERTESPTRRRGSTSPTKRPVRRMSQDGRSPSPAKLYAAQSPISPGGSSGFSSRRSSQDGFHLEDLSPVQQQLSEINNRYGLLGVRLTDRQTELDGIKDELRRHMDNLKTLSQFLEKIQRQIPKESMPSTKEEADKTAKQIKAVIEEMYEKQSLLDTTRTQVRDLVRRKKGANGVDKLNDEMEDVTNRWWSFNERCKDRIKFLDDVKNLYDTSEGLVSWLGSKERMLSALGPISADPRMVASQVQQVQVLREEFRTQQPQLDHLVQVGESVLSVVGIDSADGQRTSANLKSILDKWSDQLGRLDERAQSLGDAVDTSREFDASLNRLRDALQAISDNLDELTLEKDPEDQLRKIENLERQLEGQRPLLADAEAAGEQLCEVLSDPASKSEIHGKLTAVGKLYTNLQKKLDHKKAEIEGNLRDGRQFEASCTKTLGWLADEWGNMSEKLLVSADRDVLQQQLDHHEPIYRNVMGKEHEVIMLLNKGRDMLAKSEKVENRSLQRDLDKMQSQWDRLKKDMLDRHTKLQTCAEHCKKYYKAQDAFLPWLRQAEDRLECLKPASFKRKDIEKQLKELSSFRNEVWKHSGEFENNKTLGETFLGACDIDKQIVKNELGAMKTRWDKLNNDLLARTQSLEDTARHLMDFNENLRDLRHSLQRCEDKLASHDALGGAAKDPKLLDRIKSLREETSSLKKPLQCVKQQANDLVNKASEQGIDATHLQDEVDNLTDRISDSQAKLDDRCTELQSAATAVAQFNDQVKSINQQISTLEKDLDSMRAPGREIKLVRSQIEETTKVMNKLSRLYEEVTDLEGLGERLVDYGFAADAVATREQVAGLKRQIGKLDDRSRDRHDELTTTLDKLQEFYQSHVIVMSEIDEANEHVRKFKPVGSEVESIKVQQEDFRLLKISKIEPLARAVEDCNVLGQSLIQTASRDVNTSNIEKDVDKMNERWNDLKDRLNERDRRLDVGLLQSGKFQEALDGLEKWLTDTEEMVSNQKSPSSDYKVVKAQLQEQKFLKKMLLDRQNSMSSLYNMGQEVAVGADSKERKMIEKQLKELVGRFDNLMESAAERMEALEQAMGVAKQFQDKLVPLAIWLDKTEKRIRDMELVPTDEEKIQQRVTEHDALHEDILSRKPDFSELTEIASQLMALVGEDEAAALADKLQDAADRYAALVERSEALGGLLQRSRQGLRHLVLSYQELQAWMEGMEIRLLKYRILAVHTEKLLQQMEDLADLTEEVSTRQTEVDSTTDAGLELMKHISSDEALQLKDKLDSLQRRFNDLVSRGSDLLRHAQESLPLVQQFHDNHNRLMDWMQAAESALQSAEPREDEIVRLEMEISEYRPVLDKINAVGPQLSQLSPGEGAATIEGLVTRDNRRFDAIAEQIQRKAERIQLSKQRSLEVIGDIDDLLEWFREVDNQLREAEPPSSEPEIIRVQLKEHKALNDDISSQKGRVRDVISTAKKVIRENGQHEDTSTIREKMEDLRETMEIVSGLSADRLGALEQALPLAEHLRDTHIGLVSWLEEAEQQVAMLPMPALRPDLIAAQQDKNELLMQSINEHRPLVEKLNKTGEALLKLCNEEEGMKIQDILEADTARYAALRAELRSRQQKLEQALQESSQFSDKLEGMLRALSSTADQVNGAEPISAHPGRLRDQMEENSGLVEELAQRSEAYAAVKRAADDVISKAGNRADPAVKDIKRKLEKLNKLWSDVQKSTSERGHTLDDALTIAEKFWSELNGVMSTLRELQDALAGLAPPAAQPAAIQQQQVALQEIRHEIDQTKPDVEQVRVSGHELMGLCGEPDKPEVRKHIEDLDQAWDNVTALYARREENLIDAMEKAMEFHETLQNLLEFLQEGEDKFARMGPLGSDIDEVKKQIKQLANFKAEVDPHMVKVEALNRQAAELTERTSSEQAAAIKEPLGAVNKRWDGLLRGLVERQRLLENALLRLGQFQHALDELLVWIEKTDDTLDNLKAVAGDPQVIEVELAKLKVLVNDIQAHQTSVDTLNDAGRQLIEDGKGTAEASTTAEKLGTLNRRWRDLLQRAADRQRELEDALREAQSFTAEIQDLLSWLGDVDNAIVASKPVGGLPETASEQLERFMEVHNELEQNRPKVETVLQQGQEYLKRADATSAGGLNHNLKTLKQRWDNVTARANDKKIKLEIALKEATEFHDALQSFVDWLTNAEKILTNLKPVSRVMETILSQIEEHKSFQKDVGVHRETMLNLDKKGTHLKYFSQKQDVILIKNLLISVQHRWERVVSKSAERTRALDHGYKEAREFHDAWSSLMNWLDETEKTLDEVAGDGGLGGNDPERIKARLNKHRELQKALSAKQAVYDATMKNGKTLKDKAPKTDESALKELLNELKNKWTTVCGKCVDRQRRLEEALLFSGQFKDAIQALLEWLSKSEKQLANTGPLHGDLDTVVNLVEQHKTFEKDLESRASQMESVIRTGRELLGKATPDDASAIGSQLAELNDLWDAVSRLSSEKTERLEEALREAERLHKAVHVLLEWLSDAEMKLRFAGQLPEDEQESRNQLMEHEKFLRELRGKEMEKDQTLELAHAILAKAHPDGALVIKHWITIIQSRWEEVATWAQQRNHRLENHMRGLQDLDNLLEELLSWLEGLENTLNALEAEPLPDDKSTLEMLIADHREFMENTSRRQDEVDRVCKARQIKPVKDGKKISKAKSPAPTRASPGRERTPDSLPHIGPRFPPKGSKGAEPEFRSPRVKLLWDRWRHVWMLAWERQRRLQDKYNYIQELDRVANFSWEDWRKRFLKFMNHKKSRLTDLFRKMDKNNDGLIPREDFIQGIMNTKFETSRLEMGAVADLFDRHGEGLIDWKEFIAALRPDWEERRTYNDTDKIHDEVKRLVMLCTCRQKFRVFQVGEGKYRFGDSQKLRLVRILRSTVMVRVGGGWVALDEFLLKNDPCRAKGRTNIELREQFILADGVSQTMTAFRSKPSPTSTLQRTQMTSANTGPITKVRERSARSVPMGQSRASRSSLSAGTPDSLSDNESSFRIGSARKTSTPYRSTITPGGSRPSSRPASRPTSRPTSRPGSRPASRQGSKPPSRYGSTQSLDSTDDSTNMSRIPRRTTVGTTGNTPTSSRHNSVSGKRLGTPVNGSSSRPRTPTGLVSPASGVPARFGTIHRASSIPTLTGVGTPISRSRIPVYVGTDIKSPQSTTSNISTHSTQSNHSTVSTDSTGSSSMCTNSTTNTSSAIKKARTRTPSSGSSTPLPPSLKLSRKPSGASDTSVSTTPTTQRRGKPTPIDQRAPFRL